MSSIFYPRPEAQAVTWDELLTPVSSAVCNLLVRIHGAHHSNSLNNSDSSTQQTGNCFIVYGSRGTGKTTVLLNAQRAVCQKHGKSFFYSNNKLFKQEQIRKKTKEQAKEQAKELRNKGIVWLDILNLEPLPSEANLLTVLLTQIRNSLDNYCANGKKQRSIFEEDAGNARQQLNDLINDATLMWQNIKEQDTRNTSTHQVKAADIYASFQGIFKKAMAQLVYELKELHSLEEPPSIVLPIDNIDRSTDHLQSIVKLAQLVSHSNLWFVMAGDRVEVETFLERAYWKELIRNNDGTGAKGKIGNDGEDEALVLARRQAYATAQKLWPANHRIEVNLVKHDETLRFKLKHHIKSNKSVKDLFDKIRIPSTKKQRDYQEEIKSNVTLVNLFEVSVENGSNVLTENAKHALLLPARSVLDLWQLLDWLVKDNTSNNIDFKAEKIARTMLRNIITSSQMPNRIAQNLQSDIIRRGEKGGTILYFGDTRLTIKTFSLISHDFDSILKPIISPPFMSQPFFRSQVVFKDFVDITLWLEVNPIFLDSYKIKLKEPFQFQGEIELTPLVGAWLVILYDILIMAEGDSRSWLLIPYTNLNVTKLNKLISINHEAVFLSNSKRLNKNKTQLNWRLPNFGLFLGYSMFGIFWQDFRERIKSLPENKNIDLNLFSIGWVFCVLKTLINLMKLINAQFPLQNIEKELLNFLNEIISFKKKKQIKELENKIIHIASQFYILIQKQLFIQQQDSPHTEYDVIVDIMNMAKEWMETELIYFLSYGYVPIDLKNSKKLLKEKWMALNTLENKDLQIYWKENIVFILTELEERIEEFFVDDEGNEQSLAKLLFADLYQLLDSPKN